MVSHRLHNQIAVAPCGTKVARGHKQRADTTADTDRGQPRVRTRPATIALNGGCSTRQNTAPILVGVSYC